MVFPTSVTRIVDTPGTRLNAAGARVMVPFATGSTQPEVDAACRFVDEMWGVAANAAGAGADDRAREGGMSVRPDVDTCTDAEGR